jgi:hypothetical protein
LEILFFGKYAGTELKLEGKDYLIMREDDILCNNILVLSRKNYKENQNLNKKQNKMAKI